MAVKVEDQVARNPVSMPDLPLTTPNAGPECVLAGAIQTAQLALDGHLRSQGEPVPVGAARLVPSEFPIAVYGVFIVEDDDRMRDGVVGYVRACPSLRVLGSAASVAAAIAWSRTTQDAPRVLLTDLGLPDGDGKQVISVFLQTFPACEALVLSMFGDEEHVLGSIAAGALGYIQKDASPDGVVQAILDLVHGASPISPAIARGLLTRMQTAARPVPPRTATSGPSVSDLSAIESEVLELLARGFSYKEIAGLRGVTSNTVASQVKSLYRKLNVRSRGEAVFEGLQSGIIGRHIG